MFSSCPEFVSDLLPATDETFNLGSPSKKWLGLYLRRFTVDALGNADLVGALQINGSLSAGSSTLYSTIPALDATYDLGTAVKRWSRLYLSHQLDEPVIPVLTNAKYPNALLLDGSRAMTGDLDLAANKLLTPNLQLYELNANYFCIGPRGIAYDPANLKNLVLGTLAFRGLTANYFITSISCSQDPWAQCIFQTWNGSAWIDALNIRGQNYGNDVVIPRAGDITLLDDKFLKIGKDSDGALPAASSTYRGKMIRVEGGAGVADKLYVCMKSTSDAYSWVQVASG